MFAAASLSGGWHPAAGAGPQRDALVRRGEAALAQGELDAAQAAFDGAAALAHVADAELGLARTHMQRGDYGRALALAAHVAGDHADDPASVALHAWLLHCGGQGTLARHSIDAAAARGQGTAVTPLLAALRAQLESANPLASGRLLDPPARLAPYGAPDEPPMHGARVVASATLVDRGRRALAPLRLVPTRRDPAGIWVRDGLGRVSAAAVERSLPALAIALLRLDRPLESVNGLLAAPGAAFAGSIAHTARYSLAPDAAPAWPLLATGFVGAPRGDGGAEREFDWTAPGQDGGPVFDAAARFIGIAVLRQDAPAPRLALLQHSQIDATLAQLLPVAPTARASRVSSESIYETALRSSLQVIVR